MSKLYVFGIGGTGSRVLRALTMLLASGVECKVDTIVPIIIDPDASGADLTRTIDIMKQYEAIHKELNFEQIRKNRFFKTNICQTIPNFRLPISNTQDVRFAEYMNVSEMSKENQALVDILFSQKNLASDMKVGFKGNPNVGSVVLNLFDESVEFKNFATAFQPDDKIFIISSIFGGTGASGFPLLLKTLRTSDTIANKNFVNNAHIGAITVLPYFTVKQDENSQIDSATFVSKAKSALAYYERNISKNNTIDNLYYIADTSPTAYENKEGGQEQKNNAHFVELSSAMAILHFASLKKPTTSEHYEFGIEADTKEVIFSNLGSSTNKLIRKSLTQFLLFAKYLNERGYSEFSKRPWIIDHELGKTFFDSDFVADLMNFQSQYLIWLKEMAAQDRSFTPFDLNNDNKKVFDLIKGVVPKRIIALDSNFDLFDNRLDKLNRTMPECKNTQKLLEFFYQATETLVKDKFNFE